VPSDFNTYLFPGPGDPSVTVQILDSNTTVGTPSATSATFAGPDSNGYPPASPTFQFNPLSVGQTTLSFSSNQILVPDSSAINFSVGSTASPSLVLTGLPVLPAGFQGTLSAGLQGSTATGTLTSSDPSRLVLSLDPTQPGSGSVTLTGEAAVSVQALAGNGDVTLTLNEPGYAPMATTVHLTTPMLYGSGVSSIVVVPGQLQSISSYSVGVAGGSYSATSYLPNPGSPPVVISLQSSNPNVATTSAAVILAPPSSSNPYGGFANFSVTGQNPGTARITVSVTGGIPLDPASTGSTTVLVRSLA